MTRPPRTPEQREARRSRERGERARRDNLWRMYRITLEEFDAMREAQDYRCAICQRHEDEITERHRGGRPRKDGSPPAVAAPLVVDHCHRGGGNRALLCAPCNIAIGNMADDPARLRAAADYVEKWALIRQNTICR